MNTWPPVRVPGKVFLAGEYGVLVGGPSLVMAVQRFARLQGTHARPATDFERGGLARLEAAGVALPAGLPAVDADELRDDDGVKLGLGSSAAWSVAVTTSALLASGTSARELHRDPLRAWTLAHAVHGGGSGADVACCLMGGIVHFQRPEAEDPPRLEATRLAPDRIPLVVHGGRPVSTASALSGLSGPEAAPRLDDASRVGARLCSALLEGSRDEVLDATRESARVLLGLGEAAGMSPEESGAEVVASVERVLAPFGGAAKPSGASGAELVLAYLPGVEPGDRSAVQEALSRAGHKILPAARSLAGALPLETPTEANS